MSHITRNEDGSFQVRLGVVIGEDVVIGNGEQNNVPYVINYPKESFLEAFSKFQNTLPVLGEINTPKHVKYETYQQFCLKSMSINIHNVSHQITDVKLVNNSDNKVCVVGTIKPVGPYANVLLKMLNDLNTNITFGLRAYGVNIQQTEENVEIRDIGKIITWDVVCP